jgi:hypothetical protein
MWRAQVNDKEAKSVILSRSWATESMTIPAGTLIWVTTEQERALREDGLIEDWHPPLTSAPPEDDEDFYDVRGDSSGELSMTRWFI